MSRPRQSFLPLAIFVVLATPCFSGSHGGRTYKHLVVRVFDAPPEAEFPPDFRRALTRHLSDRLAKTNRFERVSILDGSDPIPSSADIVLQGKIARFVKGSRAARYMVPGLGATSIRARVQFLDPASQAVLCQKEVSGKVVMGMFGGDSKGATNGVAGGVAKLVKRDLP